MSSVTIVIVSFNSEAVIADCLSPLLNDERCRAIIVDNGSSDHSAERLRKNFPAAEVIALDNNIGYGRAANCALKKIGTPYALLLNPDLKVSYDGVEKLLAHALNSPPEVAIWGPATSESDITDKAHNRLIGSVVAQCYSIWNGCIKSGCSMKIFSFFLKKRIFATEQSRQKGKFNSVEMSFSITW